jgi:hypothetical protein
LRLNYAAGLSAGASETSAEGAAETSAEGSAETSVEGSAETSAEGSVETTGLVEGSAEGVVVGVPQAARERTIRPAIISVANFFILFSPFLHQKYVPARLSHGAG